MPQAMNPVKVTADGPVPRTRPRNRRALILTAAAALFAERGYERVGMSEIAEAVAVRPSAIYGHFAGKQDLLYNVILAEFTPARALIADLSPGGLDSVLNGLVEASPSITGGSASCGSVSPGTWTTASAPTCATTSATP